MRIQDIAALGRAIGLKSEDRQYILSHFNFGNAEDMDLLELQNQVLLEVISFEIQNMAKSNTSLHSVPPILNIIDDLYPKHTLPDSLEKLAEKYYDPIPDFTPPAYFPLHITREDLDKKLFCAANEQSIWTFTSPCSGIDPESLISSLYFSNTIWGISTSTGETHAILSFNQEPRYEAAESDISNTHHIKIFDNAGIYGYISLQLSHVYDPSRVLREGDTGFQFDAPLSENPTLMKTADGRRYRIKNLIIK